MISFKLITGLQTLHIATFVYQLINDSNVGMRAFTIVTPKTKYTSEENLLIPLVWIIMPALILQLISSVFMTILSNFMKNEYGHIKLNRDDQWKLNLYKTMFIVATFTVMLLTYSYCVDYTPVVPLSGMYKTWLMLVSLISILFPIANVINSNYLCSAIYKTTQ